MRFPAGFVFRRAVVGSFIIELFFSFGYWILPSFFFTQFLNDHIVMKYLKSLWFVAPFLGGFTGFHWVLLGFTGFYWVLPGFTGFYWVLLGSNGFYWVLLVITVF